MRRGETNVETPASFHVIVHGILSGRQDRFNELAPRAWETTVAYGSKSLRVIYDPQADECMTLVENVPGLPRRLDETTLLYAAAKEIMQEFATRRGRPVSYAFLTENISMRDWARTKGRGLFSWDAEREYADPDEPPGFVFIKTIHPAEAQKKAA
jgi:hypothetical protein